MHLNQRVLFNLVNLGKTRSLFRIGMTPVVKSTSRPRWQRIRTNQVYYYVSPEHDEQMVLSIAFSFDRENETYSFALTYPYSYSRLVAIMKRLSKRRSEECQIIKMETIAKSLVRYIVSFSLVTFILLKLLQTVQKGFELHFDLILARKRLPTCHHNWWRRQGKYK